MKNDWPSIILDLSSPEATATVVADHDDAAGLSSTVAVLLRDDSGWWQSTGKVVGSGETTLVFNLGLSAFTWNEVSNADVDDVDDSDEAALAVGAAGTPNFENIEGMGLRILSAAGSTSSTALRVISMSLDGPIVTAAENWAHYK